MDFLPKTKTYKRTRPFYFRDSNIHELLKPVLFQNFSDILFQVLLYFPNCLGISESCVFVHI